MLVQWKIKTKAREEITHALRKAEENLLRTGLVANAKKTPAKKCEW